MSSRAPASRPGTAPLRQVRWWVFIVLGLALGWLLHEFAAGPVTGVGPLPVDLVVGLADAGQYLLPLFCAVLAGLSVRQVAPAPARSPARNGGLPDFSVIEPLLLIALAQRGFMSAPDQPEAAPADALPIDLPDARLLRPDGELYLLRWRHLADRRVGASAIGDLFAAMQATGARGAFLVTSGGFTREACAIIGERELHLVDGVRMMRWIEGVRGARPEAGTVHESLRRVVPAGDVATAVAVAARNGRGGGSSGPATRMGLPAGAVMSSVTARRAL
ncbi:restriction endonuclease [Derxia lacustris]|uniref:restriction endonuclease n=1 Tax=Derxia lacustris TaxID=764842 RepID=UPI00111C5D78|nr:restriction endonuclease [Derxia lacustris]